jgi:hypothetical protein
MLAHKEIRYAASVMTKVKDADELTIDEIFRVMHQAGSIRPITDVRAEMRRCSKYSIRLSYSFHEYFRNIDVQNVIQL